MSQNFMRMLGQLASILVTVAVATTGYSQLAEAIDAVIDDDTRIILSGSGSVIVGNDSGSLSIDEDPRTLDFRFRVEQEVMPGSSQPSIGAASHEYLGHVRLKWIGSTKPGAQEYSAKFRAYCTRAVEAIGVWQQNISDPRSFSFDATISGTKVSPLLMDFTSNSNSPDSYSDGNVELAEVFSVKLPVPGQSNPEWIDMGDVISGVTFNSEAEGFFGDAFISGVSTFTNYLGYSTIGSWGGLDYGACEYRLRVVYVLTHVGGQPVQF